MLSIGEFSKICKVSTKTLRYYDEQGLMKPEGMNTENGYRYYAIPQLKTMLLIQRLKTYHFSLEEIRELLAFEDGPGEELLARILNRKRQEIQEKLHAMEYSLQQISRDIQNVEQGIPLMSYMDQIEVELVENRPRNILSMRRMMSSSDFDAGYAPYLGGLYEQIAVHSLTLQGTPITIYHSPEYNPAGNDTEFAIPIEETVSGTRVLPGGLCARSVLKGPYSELTSLYAKLRGWVEEHGFVMGGSPYEIYLTDPGQAADSAEQVTEVYFPLKAK